MTLIFVKPSVTGELGDDGLANGPGADQLLRTLHLGIHSAIVSHSEGASSLFRCLHHQARLGLIHSHWLLAQHMLARAKRLDGLWRVKEDRSRNVDRLNFRIGESFVEGGPS